MIDLWIKTTITTEARPDILSFLLSRVESEKTLPGGDFFLLWAMVLKNLDLFVHDFWPKRHAIHKSTSIILPSQLLN